MASNSSNLYDPKEVFPEETVDSDTQQKVLHEDQILRLAIRAKENNIIIKVITPEESFIGSVKDIIHKEDTTLVCFSHCVTDKGPYKGERQYFTFDIMEITDWIDTESEDMDFSILNRPQAETPQQVSQAEQPAQERFPTPKSDSEPCKYDLPIQEDGRVDMDFMKLTWRLDDPKISTFSGWCRHHLITAHMLRRNLQFGHNALFLRMKARFPTRAMLYYNMWISTFKEHRLTFEAWYQLTTQEPLPKIHQVGAVDANINLIKYHLDAFDEAEKSTKNRTRMHQLREIWASCLIAQHNYTFKEWLATPTGIRHASAQCEELEELDLPTEVDIKPFDNLFKHDAYQESIHKDEITTFILEHNSRQIFQGPSTEIDHNLMQPGSLFGKLFLPNYPYVPHGVQQHLKFPGKLDEHTHLQQIIWQRLRDAQRKAYNKNGRLFTRYIEDNKLSMTTPFALRYKTQKMHHQPHITHEQMAQHLAAHAYATEKGGPGKMDKSEFYDLFIRPLEFLCGQGMPLHSCLISSIHNYSSRCSLFKMLLEIAGFTIHDMIPIQQHYAYAEISKIRHLSGKDLTSRAFSEKGPLHRLESMPRITYQSKTSMEKLVDPQDFAPNGKFSHVIPHPFNPLPDQVLDEFKKYGGRQMPLCDEFALHTQFLRAFKQYHTKNANEIQKDNARRVYTSTPKERPNIPHTQVESEKPKSPTKPPRKRLDINKEGITNTQSWVKLTDIDQQPPSAQRMSPIPSVRSSIPESSNSRQDDMISLSVTQLQQLMRPTLPAEPPKMSSQEWEFSQSTPVENVFFQQKRQTYTPEQPQRPRTAGSEILPEPRYHPTIHPRPTWDPPQVGSNQKTFDTSLIWSCTNHYYIPEWAKTAHSACSLYDIVDRQAPITETTKARFREMPHFRQFPADGLNSINDMSVFYQHTTNHKEIVIIKVVSQPYHNTSKNTTRVGQPETTEVQIPSHMLARFNIFFFDVANTQLKPAMSDVQMENHILMSKLFQANTYNIEFTVIITEGHNGLERTLRIHVSDNHTTQIIQFPWIRTANVLLALRMVHEELHQSGFI
jgi:hypothetical protein